MSSSNEIDPEQTEDGADAPLWLRVLALVVVAILFVATIASFAWLDICEDVVTDGGDVVDSCRHLELTDPPVAAGGLIMLLALGPFFAEISGFGFSFKQRIRSAEKQANLARRAAQNASGVAASAEQTADLAEALSRSPQSGRQETGPVSLQIEGLAAEYNKIRQTQRSGPGRTREMTSVVSRMINALTETAPSDFDVSSYLATEDRGLRLAGYAYVYANPDPRRVQEVVGAVVEEDKPFGQYWGLRALHELVSISPDSLDPNSVRELLSLQRRVGPGTDRWHQISRILAAGGVTETT